MARAKSSIASVAAGPLDRQSLDAQIDALLGQRQLGIDRELAPLPGQKHPQRRHQREQLGRKHRALRKVDQSVRSRLAIAEQCPPARACGVQRRRRRAPGGDRCVGASVPTASPCPCAALATRSPTNWRRVSSSRCCNWQPPHLP